MKVLACLYFKGVMLLPTGGSVQDVRAKKVDFFDCLGLMVFRVNNMNIAEHKLDLFRQIDKLSAKSLVELEKIIIKLQFNNENESRQSLIDGMKNEDVCLQGTEVIKTLWQEGIESGNSQLLDMQAIKDEALQRYNKMNRNNGS
jgi:hypothetical protein